MNVDEPTTISRRRLFARTGMSAGAGLFARRPLYAKEEVIAPTMVNAAAKAKIGIQLLRRKIPVLEASGEMLRNDTRIVLEYYPSAHTDSDIPADFTDADASLSFATCLVAIRANVASLKKQGRSLDETIAAKPTSAYDAKWGHFLVTPAMFTGLVYAGV